MVRGTRERWAKLVSRWASSGLTAKEFAQEAGINAGTLQYYKWRLGCEGRGAHSRKTATRDAGFVELRSTDLCVPECAGARERIEVLLVSGARVLVPADFDADVLRRVVDTLERAR